MNALRTLVVVGAIAGVTATPANAQDFRFTVPVQVSKLPPNVKTLTVTCEVGAVAGSAGPGPMRVAGKGTSAPLALDATGSFSGDVPVTFNLTTDIRYVNQVGYVCRLFFTALDPATRTSFDYFRVDEALTASTGTGQSSSPAVYGRTFPTAAGTTSVLEAKGPAPRTP